MLAVALEVLSIMAGVKVRSALSVSQILVSNNPLGDWTAILHATQAIVSLHFAVCLLLSRFKCDCHLSMP